MLRRHSCNEDDGKIGGGFWVGNELQIGAEKPIEQAQSWEKPQT